MPQSHLAVDVQSLNIAWPTCPNCETLMRPALTEADMPDRRTFECPVCKYTENVKVEYC